MCGDKHSSIFCQAKEKPDDIWSSNYKDKYREYLKCTNGTARFKNVYNWLNSNIYSYLEISGGQSFNLYLNVVHIFNTSVNYVAA
jgi:hypothetical protein